MSEITLWRAVVYCALEDACWQPPVDQKKHKRSPRFKDRDAAINWFESDARDFRLVCDAADLHPDWVRSNALSKIKASGESVEARLAIV